MPKPKKRSALEVLTKKCLVQLARVFELDIPGLELPMEDGRS